MNEVTRKLQKYIRSRCFGGPLKVGALCQWHLWHYGRYSTGCGNSEAQKTSTKKKHKKISGCDRAN